MTEEGGTEEGAGPVLHAVVHYPRLDSDGLNEFRRRHDPFAELIEEHLTLVFPVPVRFETIHDHVRNVALEVRPFDIRVAGLQRTWDHWLYLGLAEGYQKVVGLHDRLYSGPLEEHLRTDLPYEPHIALGFFGEGPYDPLDPVSVELDAEAYRTARREAAQLGIDASRRVESLVIVRLDPRRGKLDDVGSVRLGSYAGGP